MRAARNHWLSEAARRWNSLGREMGKDTAWRARVLFFFPQSRQHQGQEVITEPPLAPVQENKFVNSSGSQKVQGT